MRSRASVRKASAFVIGLLVAVWLLAIVVKSIDALSDSGDAPSALDVIAVIVALLGTGATTFIGLAAWRTSERSTALAERSLRNERRRDARAYEDALNDALAKVFVAIGDHITALHAWSEAADKVLAEAPTSVDPDTLPYPPDPTDFSIAVLIDSAGLVAKDDDRGTIALVDAYRQAIANEVTGLRAARWVSLTGAVRSWRNGLKSRDETHQFLAVEIYEMFDKK